MLGESISGLRGENRNCWSQKPGSRVDFEILEGAPSLVKPNPEFCLFLGMDLIGGIWVLGFESERGEGVGLVEEASLAVSEEPVSIWTTCLKEEVSAWTKVVG
ncbi:hypothetical protein V6Z11_1Z026500 [Gossypium hirsutum]